MASQAAKKVVSTVRIPPLPTARDIVKLYNLKALRQLSQNFLFHPDLINRIVKCSGKIKGFEVCEVGPGPGNITRSLMVKGAQKITLIEKDSRFLPGLQMLKEAAPGMIEIVHGDVMSYNMEKLFSDDRRKDWNDVTPRLLLIGNLPFNVATGLIIKWLRAISEKKSAWSYGRVRMTLTFQEEVAERIEAPVMTAQRCRLSVMCQNWCDVTYALKIPGSAFQPKPKVNVGVVHFVPRREPIIPLPFPIVERVVRSIFLHRNRTIRTQLMTLFPRRMSEELSNKIIQESELKPDSRSFQLSVSEIGRLCLAYNDIIENSPSLASFDYLSSLDDWEAKERDSNEYAKQVENEIVEEEYY